MQRGKNNFWEVQGWPAAQVQGNSSLYDPFLYLARYFFWFGKVFLLEVRFSCLRLLRVPQDGSNFSPSWWSAAARLGENPRRLVAQQWSATTFKIYDLVMVVWPWPGMTYETVARFSGIPREEFKAGLEQIVADLQGGWV